MEWVYSVIVFAHSKWDSWGLCGFMKTTYLSPFTFIPDHPTENLG